MDRIKKFIFKSKEYQLEFPTVGQYLQIEEEKVNLSKGKWGDFIKSGTLSSMRAIQMIECMALLKTLCPDFVKNLNVESFNEIDLKDFAELVKVYIKEINPWYSSWFKEFNDIIEETDNAVKNLKEK